MCVPTVMSTRPSSSFLHGSGDIGFAAAFQRLALVDHELDDAGVLEAFSRKPLALLGCWASRRKWLVRSSLRGRFAGISAGGGAGTPRSVGTVSGIVFFPFSHLPLPVLPLCCLVSSLLSLWCGLQCKDKGVSRRKWRIDGIRVQVVGRWRLRASRRLVHVSSQACNQCFQYILRDSHKIRNVWHLENLGNSLGTGFEEHFSDLS